MRLTIVMSAMAALCCASTAQAASIYVSYSGKDTVGQQVAYQLRESIAQSRQHKLVYSRDDAGFVIELITISNEQNVMTSYSVALLMPPFDKKGFDYYITGLAGYCGASRAQECARNILGSLDEEMSQVTESIAKAFRKPG